MPDTRTSDRRSTRTITSTRRRTSADTATAKIEYLTELLEDQINLYSNQFKKTERAKIVSILDYYGLEYGSDYEYKLFTNDYGNRELQFTWYYDPTFHDETWGENNSIEDWSNLWTTTSITY